MEGEIGVGADPVGVGVGIGRRAAFFSASRASSVGESLPMLCSTRLWCSAAICSASPRSVTRLLLRVRLPRTVNSYHQRPFCMKVHMLEILSCLSDDSGYAGRLGNATTFPARNWR